MSSVNQYVVLPDYKGRVTLQGVSCQAYAVTEYENGSILLEPLSSFRSSVTPPGEQAGAEGLGEDEVWKLVSPLVPCS